MLREVVNSVNTWMVFIFHYGMWDWNTEQSIVEVILTLVFRTFEIFNNI